MMSCSPSGGVRSSSIPSAPVGFYSPGLDDLHLIHPYQWGNIWVYPRQMMVQGYLTVAAFERQAAFMAGALAAPANPCLEEVDCMAAPLAALTPIEDLFERARAWQSSEN